MSVGATIGALGLSYESLKLMGQILEVIASLATQVVFKVQPGSLLVHVLTEGGAAKQVLLEDLSSNRLQRTLQGIVPHENVQINLVNVGAVIATEKEFLLLKKRAKKRSKHLQKLSQRLLKISFTDEEATISLTSTLHKSLDSDSTCKTYFYSLIQNKATILSQEIPPEHEKQIIECLKSNLEFSVPRSDKVTADQERTTSRSSEGFLVRHPKFSEFLQTAQLHPSLQHDVEAQLKSIKQSIWTSSTKSSVVEVEDLTSIPTPYFTGDCEKVLQDVVRISTALFLRSQNDMAFRLYHWTLDLFHNISDPSTQLKFLKTFCIAMDNALYLTKGNLKTVLFYFLRLSEIIRKFFKLKETDSCRSFSLHWLEMYLKFSLYPFLRQKASFKEIDFLNQSLLAKLDFIEALLSFEKFHKSAICQCRKLVAFPTVSTAVTKPLVERALGIAKTLEIKSKFVSCLKLVGWSLQLIDGLLPFYGKRSVRNADYKLEKLEVCSDIICRVGYIFLDDYDLKESVISWICPLLLDVNQRISFLVCKDSTKKEKIRSLVFMELAQFSCHVGQYKQAENALLSLSNSMLNDQEHVSSLSFASCFYLFAVIKQNLGDFKNALELCKVSNLFYKLSDNTSKDDRQKVINVAEKLLSDQSNKEELQRLIEVAENLLSEEVHEMNRRREFDFFVESEDQALNKAAENLELHLVSLVDKSKLSQKIQ